MPKPADSFIPNDTLIVLDLLTGAWLGIWKSHAFRLREFMPYYEGDDPRMAILAADGAAYGMFAPAPGDDDAGAAINTEARAAVRVDLRQSKSSTLIAEVENLGGRYRLAYEADGVGETGTLRDQTPDPAESLRFGGTVDFENDGDTLAGPYRADYSFEIPAVGTWLYVGGWELGARQRFAETVRVPRRGRAFTVGCASHGGRVAFRSLAIQTNTRPLGRGTEV